jgi:hypothetical protein
MGDRRVGRLGVSQVVRSRMKRRMGLLRHHPYPRPESDSICMFISLLVETYRTPSLFSRRDRIVLYHLADFRGRVRDLGSGMGGERGRGGARGDLGEGSESIHFPER